MKTGFFWSVWTGKPENGISMLVIFDLEPFSFISLFDLSKKKFRSNTGWSNFPYSLPFLVVLWWDILKTNYHINKTCFSILLLQFKSYVSTIRNIYNVNLQNRDVFGPPFGPDLSSQDFIDSAMTYKWGNGTDWSILQNLPLRVTIEHILLDKCAQKVGICGCQWGLLYRYHVGGPPDIHGHFRIFILGDFDHPWCELKRCTTRGCGWISWKV